MLVEEIEVGQELPGKIVHVDRALLVAYAEASGDDNPIHQDEQVARSVGLPDVIAHGMWTMGAAVEVVSQWIGDPARVRSYRARFTQPVVVPASGGAEIEVLGAVTKVDRDSGEITVALTVTCGGEPVLGRATVLVDGG